MPVDYKNYPPDWKAISQRIRERAGDKCETCHAPNHAVIMRSTENPGFYLISSPDDGQGWRLPDGEPANMLQFDSQFADSKIIEVVLTVAHHPDPDPMNCSDGNLHCLCQRCHNLLDAPMRAEHRKATIAEKKAQKAAAHDAEVGQGRLF